MGVDFNDNFNEETCAKLLEYTTGETWKISLASHVVASTAAALFGIMLFCLLYIFIRYLLIQSGCKRTLMMVFYIVSFMDLGTRTTLMIFLNFRPFFATTSLIISVVSMQCAILVGTVHAWILAQLNIDLRTLKCQ